MSVFERSSFGAEFLVAKKKQDRIEREREREDVDRTVGRTVWLCAQAGYSS